MLFCMSDRVLTLDLNLKKYWNYYWSPLNYYRFFATMTIFAIANLAMCMCLATLKKYKHKRIFLLRKIVTKYPMFLFVHWSQQWKSKISFLTTSKMIYYEKKISSKKYLYRYEMCGQKRINYFSRKCFQRWKWNSSEKNNLSPALGSRGSGI